MKKNFTLRLRQLFVLSTLLLCFQANAEKVEVAEAASVAHFFMVQTLGVSSDDVHMDAVYTAVDAANPAEALYYVFNINQPQGFVIVSANDIARPILGYSLQGAYNQYDMPPNFEAWMNSVAEAIGQGIRNGIASDPEIFTEWEALLGHDVNYFTKRDGEKAVNPLITTKWDQEDPYNQQCPLYQGQKCYTGCVATAMAQVMKYYAYPASGTGTTPAYTTSTSGISVPAITLGEAYQWTSMIDQYGGSATQQQKDAVALLMYHCGASVKMDYNPIGSNGSAAYSSDAGAALTTYFQYDKSMRMQNRAYFSNDQWIALLKQELDADRPMYHNGSGSAGGHAFVCDGYNNSNQFHFNWGWSGYGDGYFSITPLSSFPNNNNVFVGMKPNAGGAQAYNIDILYDNHLVSNKSSVQPMETFNVSAPIFNSGYKDATGLQGTVELYQGNNLIATMGTKSMGNLQAGYYYNSQSFSCQVPAGTPVGNYTIRIVTKTSDSNWEVARASYGYKTELPLQVTAKAYTISAQAETGGSIDPQGSIQVPEGESKTFSIKANAGYIISKVLIDGTNNPTAVANGTYTFSNVTADHSIVARFEQITHTITATAGDNGSIDPAGEVTVKEGSNQTFTIEANENYAIADVLVDGASVGALSTYTFPNVTGDHTIEATFVYVTGIKEPNTSELIIYPNPTTGLLTICDVRYAICDVEIFDMMGRDVVGTTFTVAHVETDNYPSLQPTTTINIAHLPTGIYFIRIQTETGTVMRKIVKQ